MDQTLFEYETLKALLAAMRGYGVSTAAEAITEMIAMAAKIPRELAFGSRSPSIGTLDVPRGRRPG